MAALEERLARELQWGELRRLRAQVAEQAQWFAPSPDVPWSFASHALLLLLCLQESMALLAAAYQPPPPNAKTAEAAPPLSPDTLSIAQERTVQAALQFVVMLGLCPYLLPGVGLPLGRRTEFSALVQDVVASPTCLPGATRRLYTTCTVLLRMARHSSLGSLLLAHHLGDLLAGLCQLGFCPTRRKGEQAKVPEELTVSSQTSALCFYYLYLLYGTIRLQDPARPLPSGPYSWENCASKAAEEAGGGNCEQRSCRRGKRKQLCPCAAHRGQCSVAGSPLEGDKASGQGCLLFCDLRLLVLQDWDLVGFFRT